MKLRERTDANKAVITVRNGSRSRLLSIAAAGGTSLTVVITVYTRHDVRDTSLSRFSAHVGSTRSGTRASCCRREHGRERTVLNRASIFVNFVNHFAAHKSTLGVLNRASIFVNHQNLHTTHSRKLKCCQTRDLICGLNLRCVCVCVGRPTPLPHVLRTPTWRRAWPFSEKDSVPPPSNVSLCKEWQCLLNERE